MALVVYDRVQQTGTANTTVSFTLTGSVIGFQSWAIVGNGNTTFYGAVDQDGNWEVGLGTYSTTGPTLTRTTVFSSSNSGSAVTFPGTVNIFVTYPSEKSVNLDASGNVTALGTITSGVWNGSTVPVAYGGTGVTASSGANSVVLRDANQNIDANNIDLGYETRAASGTTVNLTAASAYFQVVSGTGTQTFKLPDATTMAVGTNFVFDNDATGNVTITDDAGATVDVVASGGYATLFLEANGTNAGTWGRFGMIPAEVNWGTNSLDLGGSTVITNGVWHGTPIAVTYGGTGLNAIAAANYALYSSAPDTLTAGTLPAAAGGTGITSPGTAGNVLTSTGSAWTSSPAVVTSPAGSNTQVQYNDSGSFGASANFTWDGTSLKSPIVNATNGIIVNSQTVSASYVIPVGSSASSVGPITVATGQTVTVSSGSRWIII